MLSRSICQKLKDKGFPQKGIEHNIRLNTHGEWVYDNLEIEKMGIFKFIYACPTAEEILRAIGKKKKLWILEETLSRSYTGNFLSELRKFFINPALYLARFWIENCGKEGKC